MQKASTILLFLYIISNAYTQKYDLIATDKGDLIACRIDSITDAAIYMKMKYKDKWLHTNINTDKVIEYKYNELDKKMVSLKPGTSYIDKVYAETDAELIRALKLQKAGRTLNIVGGASLGVVGVAAILGGPVGVDSWTMVGIAGVALMIGGTSFAIGIPMNLIGKKRVEQINSNKNTAFIDITFDLKPGVHYNPLAQNYQPGVMLRIRF